MTVERTEADGISGRLVITCAGQPVTLRCLTIDETDTWGAQVTGVLSALEVGTTGDAGDVMAQMLRSGSQAAAEALAAYDVDGVLGGVPGIRARMTPVEVHEAMEVVYVAAYPYDEDAARSVASVYGTPTRMMATALAATMDRLTGPSMRGALSGGTPGTTPSARRGRRSSSSSAGPTATTSNGATADTPATLQPTA